MKKFLILFSFALAFVLFVPQHSEAEISVGDSYASLDAKITPYEYAYLMKNAGIASYVYTDYNVDLNPKNMGNFELVEKGKTFFVVKYRYPNVKALINNNGLVVVFTDRTVGNSKPYYYADSTTSLESVLKEAAKIFVGPTITKMNYINFEQLEDNRLFSVTNTGVYGKITIPYDAVISSIKTFNINGYSKEIVKSSFTPSMTHDFNWNNGTIDDISMGAYGYDNFVVSYNSRNYISYILTNSDRQQYVTNRDLTNKFTPYYKDITSADWFYNDVNWAVLKGLIQGYEDGSYNPLGQLTESQFISILTKYYGVKTIEDSNEYDSQAAYSYFNQIASLDGWKDKAKRVQPISRGKVAILLSATAGGPKTQNEAIQFLIDHNLSTAKTVTEYNANGNLRRSQIAAFFQRMNENGYTSIK